MTETHATTRPAPAAVPRPALATSSGTPVFPPGRYGRRRGRRSGRLLPVLLALALVAALGVVSVRLYRQYGDPNYRAQVISYTEITESQVVIEFRVTVPEGGSARCVLRARSRDGAEVGREEVVINTTSGDRHPTVRHQLATTGRALIGEVVRCRPAG